MTAHKPITVDRAPAASPACIDPSAIVSATARIAVGAWIGPNVEIGNEVVVGPGTVIGFVPADGQDGPVRIGDKTWIGPGVCIEPGVTIGKDCRIDFGSMIRAGSSIGQGVLIGNHCTLMPHCRIDDFASLVASVYICEYAHLEPSCQIMPGVTLVNDVYPPTALDVRGPVIGKCSIIGVDSLIWPGVKLGYHSMVASMSEVKRDVADYSLVRGQPAQHVCDVREIRMKLGEKWIYPYPWMRHNIEGEDITKPG